MAEQAPPYAGSFREGIKNYSPALFNELRELF
jgi:hypothetical protein